MVRVAGQVGRTVIHFKCENCGADGQRFKGTESEHMFCSRACYWSSDFHSQSARKANAARNTEAATTKPCGWCGIDVRRYNSRGARTFYCSDACRFEGRRNLGPQKIPATGYVLVFVGYDYPGATKSGHILEHRKVMQEMLGRDLLPSENVHHLNGQKDDNRPENLELWSRSQPAGQRVVDKLRWAREFLATYEALGEADAEADSQARP